MLSKTKKAGIISTLSSAFVIATLALGSQAFAGDKASKQGQAIGQTPETVMQIAKGQRYKPPHERANFCG